MKLIKPKFEIINKDNTIYLKAKTVFINRYIHPEDGEEEEYNPLERYCLNKHSKVKDDGDNYYVTTSIETLLENGWGSDLKYICDPTEYHEKRLTVKFICSNNFYNLLTSKYLYIVRNFSISKNLEIDTKDNELTFIIPPYVDAVEGSYTSGYSVISANLRDPYGKGTMGGYFYESLRTAEKAYMELVTHEPIDPNIIIRMKPQEARAVLPNSLKTELGMTGFESDWKKLFNVVKDEELKELLDPLKEEFIKNNYINE